MIQVEFKTLLYSTVSLFLYFLFFYMGVSGKHLTKSDREKAVRYYWAGKNFREIGQLLRIKPKTASRSSGAHAPQRPSRQPQCNSRLLHGGVH